MKQKIDLINEIMGCSKIRCFDSSLGELIIETDHDNVEMVMTILRDHPQLAFNQLIDLTVVDMLTYGQSEWVTQQATRTGFSRAVVKNFYNSEKMNDRFDLVVHLLSYKWNHRIRVKVKIPSNLQIISMTSIWPNANWYEREAFDLFGIFFTGHPDLRRILTDYGFIGHPFRKDFPVSGQVEMRYDAYSEQCIYEKVDIEERILVPKVIR
jgi:NADH-quinone oxidoreductase subunit C